MQAPPPWKLKGNGYIFLYHFPKSFVKKFGFLSDYQANKFNGDFVGTVMLVDYETSAVGPYHELLFVPGRLNYDKKKVFSISKIYFFLCLRKKNFFKLKYIRDKNLGLPEFLSIKLIK